MREFEEECESVIAIVVLTRWRRVAVLHLLRAGVHSIIHFCSFWVCFTMFVFNNDFEMEKEDRVLLKQDTPILSKVRETKVCDNDLRDNDKYEKCDAEYFASDFAGACGAETGVTVSVNTDQTKEVVYPDMCSGEYGQGYLYYDVEVVEQCRFNWNWEVKAYKSQYSNGPFPNDNSPMEC